MQKANNPDTPLNFRYRKIIHFSLIGCLLLIQLLIAGFFYNEFRTGKNKIYLENRLKEITALENLTQNTRENLLNVQDYFQKYLKTGDKSHLNAYFESIGKLTGKLDSIQNFKFEDPIINSILASRKIDSMKLEDLKILIDSTQEYTTKTGFKLREEMPVFNNYFLEETPETFDVTTETYTDSVRKKNLFGRLGDAITGKETVRKDSTVVTLKSGKTPAAQLKENLDHMVGTINNHYHKETRRFITAAGKNQDNSIKFYETFSRLMAYSNAVMSIYESAVKNSKTEIEKEYEKLTSQKNKIREYLIIGAMILMFIVSLLILLLTRIAFLYEKKLKAASRQISENLKFKNRILGMLSHEMRAPLKNIGLFMNRIKSKIEDEKIKEYLNSVSYTSNTLMMQAGQILEYTKNQQAENRLIPVYFNLKEEVNAIFRSITPYIESRNNRFITEENIHPETMVFSDKAKINQIFMNILGNANKFTENGTIKATAHTEKTGENNLLFTATVSDTGAGISDADLQKIFEPYYQGVLSKDVENLGAGLGLSLCKELVELYPGTISVQRNADQGTTVTFSINLKINDDRTAS